MVSSNLLLTVLHVVSLSQSSMSRLWITLVVDNTQGDSMTIRILQVCYVLEGCSNKVEACFKFMCISIIIRMPEQSLPRKHRICLVDSHDVNGSCGGCRFLCPTWKQGGSQPLLMETHLLLTVLGSDCGLCLTMKHSLRYVDCSSVLKECRADCCNICPCKMVEASSKQVPEIFMARFLSTSYIIWLGYIIYHDPRYAWKAYGNRDMTHWSYQ